VLNDEMQNAKEMMGNKYQPTDYKMAYQNHRSHVTSINGWTYFAHFVPFVLIWIMSLKKDNNILYSFLLAN